MGLLALAFGIIFGMVLGVICAVLVGGPPIAWIALGATVGAVYMGSATG